MSAVDLNFARETLKEVAEWRSKIKNEYRYAFKFEYRVPYTQELYNIIDNIGSDEISMEKARIQQVVRESIESAEAEIEELVKEKLKRTSYSFGISDHHPPSTIEPSKAIVKKSKPWLPRVATLPSRRMALEHKNKETQNRVSTVKLPGNVTKKPKVKSISQLMETEIKTPKFDTIQNQYKSVFQAIKHDAAVQTQVTKKDINTVPTLRKQNHPSNKDFQTKTAVALSSPVQLIAAPEVLKDTTSSINFTQIKPRQSNRSVRRNVAVVSIINEKCRRNQLSVQTLPSISIECESSKTKRVEKNFELYIEKSAENDSSLVASPSENESLPHIGQKSIGTTTKTGISHSTTQTVCDTKNVSTLIRENGNNSTASAKVPVDSTSVRQLLHQLIASLKEDTNHLTTDRQTSEIKSESIKVQPSELQPTATESRGMLTETSETKSQLVSMEIETRSLGVTTNEKYSKTQEVQVELEYKQFKDVATLAEVLKETKDVSIPAKDFDKKENKEIAIQVSESGLFVEPSAKVIRNVRDKATEMHLEDSSESGDSSEVKFSSREIGIQVSSSGTNLSVSNDSSSSAVPSSGATTTSSSTSNISPDEPISEGEIIFKRPYLPLSRRNQMASRKCEELSVTEEYDEGELSECNSEGEMEDENLNRPMDLRPLESAQSVGEVVNLIAMSPGETKNKELLASSSPIQVTDGDSGSSSGEISPQ